MPKNCAPAQYRHPIKIPNAPSPQPPTSNLQPPTSNLQPPTSNPKRPICASCLRPQRTCICRWIAPTAHAVEVLILQHPLEVANAKGSARLLHLSLPHSRIVTGEVFDEQQLQARRNCA